MTLQAFSWRQAMAVAIASSCLLFGAGCDTRPSGRAESTSATAGAPAEGDALTRTVVDMDGTPVQVPREITSYFNAYPVSNGIMVLLGVAGPQSHYLPRVTSGNWAWLRVFNPLISAKPTIGDDAMASPEEVLRIAPQVVILSNKDTAATYRAAGLNVFSVQATTTDDFLKSILVTGELFGGAAARRAADFVQYYRDNIAFVGARVAGIPESDRPRVYYVSGTTALSTGIRGNGREFVTNAGGRFAAEGFLPNPQSTTITAEQLLRIDPDHMIVGTNNRALGYQDLMTSEALANLSAIKQRRVHKTPQGLLPWDTYGPEQAMAVVWMGKILYPQLFTDVDLKKLMADFYERFFDYHLSAEYAELMLAGAMGPEGR